MTKPGDSPIDDSLGAVFAPVRTTNAFEQTVERLGRAIRMGLLAPGEQLPSERDLAQHLALSRSTVREALRVLQEAGYLESRRGRGGATPADCEFLASLVTEMMGYHLSDYGSYRAIDSRFHIAIANISGSPDLAAAITESQSALSDVLNSVPRSEESMINSQEQHRRILAALEAHDRDAARVAMREHVEGIEHLLSVLMPQHTA